MSGLTETRQSSVARRWCTLLTVIMLATPLFAADGIQIHVFDETGKPVPSATIETTTRAGTKSFTANKEGYATVPHPAFAPHEDFYKLTVFAPGFVPSWSEWFYSAQRAQPAIPSSIVIGMEHGSTVGGKIVNDAGEPIRGAKVRLFFQIPKRPDPGGDPVGTIYHSLWEHSVLTDDQGRWHTDMAPKQWTDAFVQPAHPDYYSDESLTSMTSEKALRAGTSVATMVRGRSIAGRLIGPDGSPVAGAMVKTDSFLETSPQTTSAADGTFLIPQASVRSSQLLVSAPSLCPTLKPLPSGNLKDLEVRLPKATHLHGKVVDEKGNPLAETFLTLTGWQGSPRFDWQQAWDVYTDATGHFALDAPPGVTSTALVVHAGFEVARDVQLPDDGAEHLIVLRAETFVTGRVIDASTGMPMPQFTILSATSDPDSVTSWQYPTDGVDGHYSIKLSNNKTHRIRIEATGYKPASSAVLERTHGKYVFDAEMTPEADVIGTVVDAAGAPFQGATVCVITPNDRIVSIDSEMKTRGGPMRHETKSDEQGHFAVPPQDEAFDLLLTSEAGYAKVSVETFQHRRTVHLSHWSTIEGFANVDPASFARPEINARVRFGSSSDHTRTFFSTTAKPHISDRTVESPSGGYFSLTHAPAGEYDVTMQANWLHQSGTVYATRRVVTEEGLARRVNFEVTGRPVRVTCSIPTGIPAGWHYAPAELTRVNAYWEHGRSEMYSVAVDSHGIASFPAVPPGDYRLKLALTKPIATPSGRMSQAAVAVATSDVHVELEPKTLKDLGSVPLKRIDLAEIGSTAPDIQCTTLDGSAISLSSLRGKFVVLDFWATWCGPCKVQTPALKSLYDATINGGRLTILSLSLDETTQAAQAYVNAHDLKWPQGFIGAQNDAPAIDSYNVKSIPSLWLVNPDGKVIATTSDIAELTAAVHEALRK